MYKLTFKIEEGRAYFLLIKKDATTTEKGRAQKLTIIGGIIFENITEKEKIRTKNEIVKIPAK